MRILLVNPRFPPSLWDFSLSRELTGKKYPHPPLALPTLAGLTPRVHEVTLIDENVEDVVFSDAYDLVGITAYHIQQGRAFELADAFRARGVRVALGGPIVEASFIETCLEHADTVFLGEAEYTWPRYLEDLAEGRAQDRYLQLELVDMHDSPCPRYELLRWEAYATATVETSRGCPMSCEFCEIPARLGKRARTKSVAQIMAEVRLHHALGADSIFFIDDHFVGNRPHAKKVLEALAEFVREIDYSMYFTCQFTINNARDSELLELLRAANFRRVFVGIETPRKESLASAKKRQNLAGELLENVHTLQRYGIVPWAGMIVGFDTDDEAIFDEHRAFLAAAGIPVVMYGLLQAIPGTPLFARMASEGRLRDTEMAGVRGTYQSLVVSNITPLGMSDESLVTGYQRLVRDLYEYEAFGARLIECLRRGAPPPHSGASARPSREKLAVLARIVSYYLFGFDRRRAALFVRVLWAVLRRAPHALEAALMHLVVYKHLREFYFGVAALPLPRLPPAREAPRRSLAVVNG